MCLNACVMGALMRPLELSIEEPQLPKQGRNIFNIFAKKRIFCCLPKVLNTEMAKKVCPRLRELAPQSEAGSRNVGHTFLANAVVFFKNI